MNLLFLILRSDGAFQFPIFFVFQFRQQRRNYCLFHPTSLQSNFLGPQYLKSTLTESCVVTTSSTGSGRGRLLTILWFKWTSQLSAWSLQVSRKTPHMGYAWQGLLKSGVILGMALLAILIMLLQSMVRRNYVDISRQFNVELFYHFVRVTYVPTFSANIKSADNISLSTLNNSIIPNWLEGALFR